MVTIIKVKSYDAQKASPARPERDGDITFKSYGRIRRCRGSSPRYDTTTLRLRGGDCLFETQHKTGPNQFTCSFAFAYNRGWEDLTGDEKMFGKESPVVRATVIRVTECIDFLGEMLFPNNDILLIDGIGGASGQHGENPIQDHVLHMTKIGEGEDRFEKFKKWIDANLKDQITDIFD